MSTASELRTINGDELTASNPGGLSGVGGMDANFERALKLVAQALDDMATYLSQANFVAAQASIATIYQLCQALVAQITPGSTSSVNFPAVDKLLLSTPNVAQTYIYDTRLDDRLPDGARWNEPGRCAHLSYWNETLGTYTGVKRDVPAVLAITALKEQWYTHDALDLDPVTGMPRLWRASNPTGNGLVLCGSTSPITSVYARNGYLYFGTGMGLHIVSLTGDWCDRYDASGRRRRLGTFALRNTLLQEGGVFAAGALPATAINSVDAYVYPAALLDPAGIPIPTVLVTTSAGAAVIHPTGQVVHITRGTGYKRGIFLADGRLCLSPGDSTATAVEVGPLPYATVANTAWRQAVYDPTRAGGTLALVNGASAVLAASAAGAIGSAAGLTFLAEDSANPANGLVAYTAVGFATGWLPGDCRLATLCDGATGAISGTGELITNGDFSNGTTAGWNAGGTGGVNPALAVVSGKLRIPIPSGSTGYCWASQGFATVPGQSYLLLADVSGVTASAELRIGTGPAGGDLYTSSSVGTGQTSTVPAQFTATTTTSYVAIINRSVSAGHTVGQYVEADNITCKSVAPDRSYNATGLILTGTWDRSLLSSASGIAAWAPQAGAYAEQPYTAKQDAGTGDWEDTVIACANGGATAETWLSRDSAATGARRRMIVTAAGTVQYTVSDGTNTVTVTSVTTVRDNIPRRVSGKVKRGTNTLELWIDGQKEASASIASLGSLSNAAATLRVALDQQGANPATTSRLALVRSGATACTTTQEVKAATDERNGVGTLGGASSAVSALSRCPLTGRLAVGTGDGVTVMSGLRPVSYLDEVALAATTSDAVRSVALRGGSLLIGTAAEVGFVGDALGGKEAIAVGGPRPVGAGFTARGVTTDATPLDLAPRVMVGERETLLVEARIVGRVVGGLDSERLSYVRRATYYRDAGGNVTLQGSVQTLGTDTEVTSTADATLAIDTAAQTVTARVTGVASKRIRWEATITVNRISEETSYAA